MEQVARPEGKAKHDDERHIDRENPETVDREEPRGAPRCQSDAGDHGSLGDRT
jgi:hypothetical protein